MTAAFTDLDLRVDNPWLVKNAADIVTVGVPYRGAARIRVYAPFEERVWCVMLYRMVRNGERRASLWVHDKSCGLVLPRLRGIRSRKQLIELLIALGADLSKTNLERLYFTDP